MLNIGKQWVFSEISIKNNKKFDKDVKLAFKQGKDINKLNRIVDLLLDGKTLPDINKEHKLKGNYENARECHIEFDWILIYEINENFLILKLLRTGTHSKLFEHKK